MAENTKIGEAFYLVVTLAAPDAPLNALPGCWERDIGDSWHVALNAHSEAMKAADGSEVPPFHCVATFNGLPAAVFNAVGGGFIAHPNANEDLFIAALKRGRTSGEE